MARFSPMEAVYAGLRFVRARPATILIWSAFLLVVLTVAQLALVNLGGDQMTALALAVQSPKPDFKHVADLMQGLLPASAFALLLIVVFGAVLVTAILRAYLETGPQTWGGLRLGGDELRVLGVGLLMLLSLLCAQNFLLVLVSAASLAAPALLVPGVVLSYGLVLALGVRLSLAPTIALIENRTTLMRTWKMTRKAFWPLLGAYALLTVLMLVVMALVLMAFGALLAATATATGGGLTHLFYALRQHNFQDVNPLVLAIDVLMNLAQVWVSVVFLAVSLAVGVEAYRFYSRDVPPPR
jgi:hypothetical protein